MEVFSVNRNRMYALLLAALFLFAAAPAMATWVTPEVTGLPTSMDKVKPASLTDKPVKAVLHEPISGDVDAVLEKRGARVYVKESVVEQYFEDNGIVSTYEQYVPVFRIASNDIGATSKDVLVMLPLDSGFTGLKPSNIYALKAIARNGQRFKTYARKVAAGALADGAFAVIAPDKATVLGATENIASGSYIAFAISVSGDVASNYNVGSSDVIDPVFLFTTSGLTPVVPVAGVTVTPAKKVVVAGGTFWFSAIVSPDNATNPTVSWSSDATSVAVVSPDSGRVTVVAGVAENRQATITATSESNTSKTGSGLLIAGTPVTKVEVYPKAANILVGGSVTLTETISPVDATLKTVTWSSSNESIATVDSNGVVTGRSSGRAVIAATTDDGGATHGKTDSATIDVTATHGPEPVIPPFSDSELPSGVGVATSVSFPSSIPASGLNSNASAIVTSAVADGTTYLRMPATYIQGVLSYRSGTMDQNIYVPLPVIKGYVTSSRTTGLFMVELSYWSGFSSLIGKKAGEIALVKGVSTSASASKLFTFVDAASKFADGTFALSKDGRTLMKADEKFVSGQTYYILYAIQDGGPYDANPSSLIISDPCFVGLVTGTGSSGGGCGVAGFAPAAVLLVLPILGSCFFGRR